MPPPPPTAPPEDIGDYVLDEPDDCAPPAPYIDRPDGQDG